MTIKRGKLTLILGAMFSSKTTTLIKHIQLVINQKLNYEVIKPVIDNRYSKNHVVTHDGLSVMATIVVNQNKPIEILHQVKILTDTVFIDEINFFDILTNESPFNIIDVIELLLNKGINVTCSGLLFDFRHEYFEVPKKLLNLADELIELFSNCCICRNLCDRTQRLVNGQPARYSDPIIQVGGSDSYEPRCQNHHIVLDD